jgi:hypothetical protein
MFMLMMHHAQLVQPIAKAPVVREVSAKPVLPTALLTVVILVAIMVTAAAGSAVSRKPVVLMTVSARAACVIIPRLIALTNATPTIVVMVSVKILLKATVKRIAAN